jgi:5-methyltetrahydrofolate--homocysteine methyltransferase
VAVRPLLERLRAGETLVGDGGWGTLLMARGLRPGEAPETFNLSRPEVIEAIAREYVAAGADLVTTNSFGGSPAQLRAHGLEAQADALNRAAVEVVRRAVDGRAHVSASVGPSGRLLKPYGDTDPADLAAGFERQIAALAGAGADLVCIETMTDLAEAVLAVRAARAVAPSLPVMATMTFEPTRRGFFTVMGVSVEQAVGGLLEAGADIVGSNCGNGSAVMVDIAREFRALTSSPIAIQANAGLPERRGADVVYPEDPATFAASARALLAAGVNIIGGCCGTTPAHVHAVWEVVASGRRHPA